MQVPDNFLGAGPELSDFEKSKVVITQAPYEGTAYYGKGQAKALREIIECSKHLLEWYDEELGANIVEKIGGIHTLKPYELPEKSEDVANFLEAETKKLLEKKKFVVTLGGEHSIAIGPARAYSKHFKNNLSILCFDAHGDLREIWENDRYSHACTLKRIADVNENFVHVGCRSISDEESELIEKKDYKFCWAHELRRGRINYDEIVSNLKENVYISYDVDVFDPAEMPAVGTPEPGGLDWYDVITLVRKVGKEKNIVGFDVNELAPIENLPAYNYLPAKLAYKTIGYALLKT